MADILLSNGQKAIVDDNQAERLSKFRWLYHKRKQCFYARRWFTENGKRGSIYMHQEILGKGSHIDHIDGNGLNNRRSNLRQGSQSQNMQNRRKHIVGDSKYKGVHKSYGQFKASIRVNGTLITLGHFRSEQEAAETYNLAANSFWGEHANLNKI